MTDTGFDPVRAHELLARLCDGNLDELQRAELESLVLNNVGVADFYVKYMHLHAAISRYNLIAPGLRAVSNEFLPATIASQPPRLAPRGWRQLGRAIAQAHAAVFLLIACGFYGTFGFLIWSISQTSVQTSSSGMNSPGIGEAPGIASTQVAEPGVVAHLTGTLDCVWGRQDDSAGLAVGHPILRGQSAHLKGGVAEFKFTHDVKLLVQGPAEFQFVTGDRLRLKSGRATTLVGAAGKGFTVETADVEVVDLGTEFGVSATLPGQSDVAVFQGEVDVRYAQRNSAVRSLRLVAGQSRRFVRSVADDKSVDVVVAHAVESSFVRDIDPASKRLPPEVRYASAVLEDKPFGYWRLSDGRRGVATDSSGFGRHGSYHGALHPHQPGIRPNTNDRSVRVVGAQAEGWGEFKNFPMPESFTVEIWARSSTPVWNAFGWLACARTENGFILHPDTTERSWRGYVNDEQGNCWEIGIHTPSQIDDRLHHYAISFDSLDNVGTMYFDGEMVARKTSLLVDARRLPEVKARIEIGRDSHHGAAGAGDGWLDEFAIYDRALTVTEIARHFAAGTANE